MNTTPTPETDAFYSEIYDARTPPEMVEMASGKERDHARSLERRLVIATEALQWCHDYGRPHGIVQEEVTGPALRRIREIAAGK